MHHSKTLVASYCFPPYSDVAAVVAAKRIRESGVPVDVICNAMDSHRRKDFSLTKIAAGLVDRVATLATPTAFSSWKSIESYSKAGLQKVDRWERADGPYQNMYSRSQFAASHFLGAAVKISRPTIKWTAEFSDPLSHDVHGQTRGAAIDMSSPLAAELAQGIESESFVPPSNDNAFIWCETLVFSLADEIYFTNELQRDFMISHIEDVRLAERVADIATITPHPTLPREFYSKSETDYELEPGLVHIAYFGNFYLNRGLGPVLNSFAELPASYQDRLQIHVFTNPTGADELRHQVELLSLSRHVRINNSVDFLDFLNLTDKMSILLVNDAEVGPGKVNPFLPSKVSDYRGSRTPIWSIVEEGSTMDGLEELDFRTPSGHPTAVRQQLAVFAESLGGK